MMGGRMRWDCDEQGLDRLAYLFSLLDLPPPSSDVAQREMTGGGFAHVPIIIVAWSHFMSSDGFRAACGPK